MIMRTCYFSCVVALFYRDLVDEHFIKLYCTIGDVYRIPIVSLYRDQRLFFAILVYILIA